MQVGEVGAIAASHTHDDICTARLDRLDSAGDAHDR